MITSQKDLYTLYCDNCHSLCYCRQDGVPHKLEASLTQEGLLVWEESPQLPALLKEAGNAARTFHAGVVSCPMCRKEWPSVQDALRCGLLQRSLLITEQDGHTFEEIALRGSSRRKLVPSESGDAVHCNHCDWRGFVSHGGDTCPMCFRKGMLEWQHRSMEEAIPVLGCYVIIPKPAPGHQ